MIEFVHHAFGFVCGQPVGRTWPLDGEWLPFCQRCTGIYIGAIVALALQLAFRIRSGSRLLVVHGFLLLQIAPFVRDVNDLLFADVPRAEFAAVSNFLRVFANNSERAIAEILLREREHTTTATSRQRKRD